MNISNFSWICYLELSRQYYMNTSRKKEKNTIVYMELMNDVLNVYKLYKTGQAD